MQINPGGRLNTRDVVGRGNEIARYWGVLERQGIVISAERRTTSAGKGDGKSAIAAGREAVAKYPDDTAIQYDLAHTYLIEDRFAEALSAIDRAIVLNGADSAYLCIRADVLLGLNWFEEAIQDAQAVLDKESDHWHSFLQMLNAAVATDRPEDAEAHAMKLVRLAPTEPVEPWRASCLPWPTSRIAASPSRCFRWR